MQGTRLSLHVVRAGSESEGKEGKAPAAVQQDKHVYRLLSEADVKGKRGIGGREVTALRAFKTAAPPALPPLPRHPAIAAGHARPSCGVSCSLGAGACLTTVEHRASQVYVLWPDDGSWYRGTIRKYSSEEMSAVIFYEDTDEKETVNLEELIAEGQIAFSERPSRCVFAVGLREGPQLPAHCSSSTFFSRRQRAGGYRRTTRHHDGSA